MVPWKILTVLLMLVFTGCGSFSRAFMNASWRDRWQQPEAVVEALSIQPGTRIADLGAGGGYFTFRLADAVGPAGKVYAVDVKEDHLEYIAQKAKEQGYTNVEGILAKYDDPLLPEDGVDLIFTCNTYHHLENQTDYFASLARYLRPDGRIAVIELGGQSWFARLSGHWTPKETVRSEMEAAGYVQASDFTFLSRQHFQVFARSS